MSIINARSPYYISIEEAGSSQTEIYIYLWNGTGSAPAYPTYVLSKAVPSSTNVLCQYNISPYISEFIDHSVRQNIYPTYPINTPNSQWCNVQVKRYADGDLLDTTTYKGVDGYGYYAQGQNPILQNWLLDEGTYYYPFDITVDPAVNQLRQVGQLTLFNNPYVLYYISLNSGSIITTDTIGYNNFVDFPCVIPDWITDGNKVEVLDILTNEIVATYIFKPLEECYYEPITIDFVNKYGAWQRTFMFKASYRSLEVNNSEYNLLQSDLLSYDIQEGQRKTFNTNGFDRIKMNSGWVDASYSEVLRQLMLSNRILVNGSPVICLTKTLDIQDSLNVNLINYQIEFKYAYDTINSVI